MIKVTTFNLRCDTTTDEQMRFQFRKGLILDKLEQEKPDLIGFQECTVDMAAFLRRHLVDYLCVGNGRNADYGGENNMIAIRKDRYELMQLETFWLSETPDIPGSRYAEQSDCPRICTHVVLRAWDGGKPFHFYNTHLDHVSTLARVLGAQALVKRIVEDQEHAPYPVILTGDMNAFPADEPITVLHGTDDFPLTDLTENIPNSYHGYGKKPHLERIDYLFVHGFRQASPTLAWTDCLHGIYLSDHYPLTAFLED